MQIAEKRHAAERERSDEARQGAAARAVEAAEKERAKQRKASLKATKAAALEEQRAAFLLEQKRRCAH